MALDFHIGDNKKTSSIEYSSVSFGEKLHTLLFDQIGVPDDGRFVQFKKLEDYYQDVKYNSSELTRLVNELEELKPLLSDHLSLIQQLDNISDLCEKAKLNNTNVWVLCD